MLVPVKWVLNYICQLCISIVEAKPMLEATEMFVGGGDAVSLLCIHLLNLMQFKNSSLTHLVL